MKNREGYFLNSYSPIKWLVCVIICFVELRKSTQPSADQCRPVLQMDIFVFELAYVVYILAFLNQIEFFHKVHIKPNKLAFEFADDCDFNPERTKPISFNTLKILVSFDTYMTHVAVQIKLE